jgi:hypothetical protein
MMLAKLATARQRIEKIAASPIMFHQCCCGVNAGERQARRFCSKTAAASRRETGQPTPEQAQPSRIDFAIVSRRSTTMRKLIVCAVSALALAAGISSADAKGCIKGALVGGTAGHFAGHHPTSAPPQVA